VYVYLPPQYFQRSFRAYRFPVIELIHGQPGEPQDWISVVGVTRAFGRLLADGHARPAVLVMPDANGGDKISLQCLDQAGGPQDLTYLAVDLPGQLARTLRVRAPGTGWGVAGYSEGGFCAANMALRFPRRYGAAGVLSGYFAPFGNRDDPFTGRRAFHSGLDFAAEKGTAIHAAAGGTVVSAGFRSDYGWVVEIDHGNGLRTRYAHASRLLVKAGDVVAPGETIAAVGTTGRSTGPHLHFEVLRSGEATDPRRYLAGL